MTRSTICLILFFYTCNNRNTIVDKMKILSSDYRLFQNTPAWTLAKAVENDDSVKIKQEINNNKRLINYSDSVYGKTLLMLAVYNRNYISVKTLLELGADPNKQDNYDGNSALMETTKIGLGDIAHSDSRYLKMMLEYGGDPNAVQIGNKIKGNHTHFTVLEEACLSGVLEYVKILIEAGADMNHINKNEPSVLYAAVISRSPDIVLYLLEKGIDFKQPIFTNVKGEKIYISDAIIRLWNFDKDSKQYSDKVKVKEFLELHNSK